MALTLGARAFAFGESIHFAPGEYQPETPEGWAIIAHELTHVLQQRYGRVCATVNQSVPVVADAELELEAEQAGECARLLHQGILRSPRIGWGGFRSTDRSGSVIQCLMTAQEFRQHTSSSIGVGGLRWNILAVDRKLKEFHAGELAIGRSSFVDRSQRQQALEAYKKQLKVVNELLSACESYEGKRAPGVHLLVLQLAPLKRFLELIVEGLSSHDLLTSLDRLDQAVELGARDFAMDWHNRKLLAANLTSMLETDFGQMSQDAQLVADHDIQKLNQMAELRHTPDTLKRIIREGVAAKNQVQVQFGFNMAGFSPKGTHFEWKFKLNLGRTYRLGQAIHELTHLSIAVKFGWSKLMLCVPLDADDEEIKDFAQRRNTALTGLTNLIEQGGLGAWTEVFQGQVRYATNRSAFNKVLAAFRSQIGADYDRFTNLPTVNSELHEYDTVLNQMTMWCFLLGKKPTEPLFARLLQLADQAYQWRAKYNGGVGGAAHNPMMRRTLGT